MNKHKHLRLVLVLAVLAWGVHLSSGQTGVTISSTPVPCVVDGKHYADCTPGQLKQAKREAARLTASPQQKGVNANFAGLSPTTATTSPLAPPSKLKPTGPPPLVPTAAMTVGAVPDYFGVPNYANSPLPVVGPTGGIVAGTGLRKFVDTLPGLCPGTNDLGQCIPLATPDTTTFPGNDFYRIGLREFQKQMHRDLPAGASATNLRGYVQLDATNNPVGANQYLSMLILATKNRPVRVLFKNMIGTNLNIPVDTTYMGAGAVSTNGFTQMASQKRADLHLHGGNTPWISDGTTHQWTTPVGGDGQPAALGLAKGYSAQNVPDMVPPLCVGIQCVNPAPTLTDGLLTYYWTNKQSGRLMFFHDHAFGLTRLNVYAGEAAGYLLVDPAEETALKAATVPGTIITNATTGAVVSADLAHRIPLVIQDKTFVPDNGTGTASQLAAQDPTWDVTKWGGFGNLWFPHVYTPNQNPADLEGANGFGRWDWGPWFFPPQVPASLVLQGFACTSAATPTGGAWAFPPLMCPGVPDPTRPAPSNSPSGVPESFMDTMVVNGTAYPSLTVDPTAYRFDVLSVGNDRTLNMGLYVADPLAVSVTAGGSGYANPPSLPPTVTITGCSAATGIASVEDGSVVGITMTYPATGPGCTGTPTVAIAGPPAPVPPATATPAYAIASVNTEVRMLPAVPAAARPATLPNCSGPQPVMAGGGLVTALLDATGKPLNNTGLPLGCWPLYNSTTGFTAGPLGESGRLSWGNSDGRLGGVPDPTTAGPPIIQIGTEGGLLPAPAVIPSTPVSYDYNKRSITVLNILNHDLLLGPAERADIIVDFTAFAGKTLILYNDAPAPVPGADPRIDYFTNDPDQSSTGGATSTMAGYGPNVRTIMQIKVNPAIVGTPPATPFSLAALMNPATGLPAIFAATQDPIIVPEPAYPAGHGNGLADYARIQDTSLTLNTVGPLCAAPPCVQPMLAKAIQELFTLDYGRMNATLGVEVPLTNFVNQTTIPYGYADPPTEIFKNGETQIWKITHNGVDTHFMHFHLFTVQVINRVGWDGAIKPPDPNELSFKDTVRMNPLEDVIVALKPMTQDPFPFPVPNSIRPLNVTMPLGTTSTTAYTNLDPTNQPATVVNDIVNFGWEYVWHCHILGHEENDMMRAMILAVAPNAPVITRAIQTGSQVSLAWTEAPSPPYTSFTIQRSLDPTFPVGVSGTTSFTVGPTPLTYTDTVTGAGPWYYRMLASNLVGYTRVYAAPAAGYPSVSSDSAWSSIGVFTTGEAQMISPVPGSTLTSSTVTFTWTTGTGVTQYGLYLGSSLGAYDLGAWNGTTTSHPATVPAIGATLYVRLWSLIGGVWRYVDYTYTQANVTAQMTSPTPGSTLPGSSVTFTWTTGTGVTQYGLYLGTTAGAYDLGAWNGTTTSHPATVPAIGAILYVRLWSLIGGVWGYNDYTYTQANLTAQMISPTPGSTLPGSPVTFSWTTGTGVTQYGLYLGTTAGAYDLGAWNGTTTSHAAAVPAIGATLHVRLWSLIGGVWAYNDYTYTQANFTAQMTSPTPGSTLPGSTATFSWSTGTGVTQYGLYLGTTVGGYNLGAWNGTTTSQAFGLPAANGSTLFVRLWSLIGGIWVYNDYSYIH